MFSKISTQPMPILATYNPTGVIRIQAAALNDNLGDQFKTHIVEQKDPRFVYAIARAVTADVPNKNHDMFPLDEIKRAYTTFIGRNIFLDHNTKSVRNAVGKVIAAELREDEEGHTYVACLFKVDRELHPDIARKIENGIIDSVSMGANVQQTTCSICNHSASREADFCDHQKAPYMYADYYAINHGVEFTELSLVSVPADPTAHMHKVFNYNTGIQKNAVAPSPATDVNPEASGQDSIKENDVPLAEVINEKEPPKRPVVVPGEQKVDKIMVNPESPEAEGYDKYYQIDCSSIETADFIYNILSPYLNKGINELSINGQSIKAEFNKDVDDVEKFVGDIVTLFGLMLGKGLVEPKTAEMYHTLAKTAASKDFKYSFDVTTKDSKTFKITLVIHSQSRLLTTTIEFVGKADDSEKDEYIKKVKGIIRNIFINSGSFKYTLKNTKSKDKPAHFVYRVTENTIPPDTKFTTYLKEQIEKDTTGIKAVLTDTFKEIDLDKTFLKSIDGNADNWDVVGENIPEYREGFEVEKVSQLKRTPSNSKADENITKNADFSVLENELHETDNIDDGGKELYTALKNHGWLSVFDEDPLPESFITVLENKYGFQWSVVKQIAEQIKDDDTKKETENLDKVKKTKEEIKADEQKELDAKVNNLLENTFISDADKDTDSDSFPEKLYKFITDNNLTSDFNHNRLDTVLSTFFGVDKKKLIKKYREGVPGAADRGDGEASTDAIAFNKERGSDRAQRFAIDNAFKDENLTNADRNDKEKAFDKLKSLGEDARKNPYFKEKLEKEITDKGVLSYLVDKLINEDNTKEDKTTDTPTKTEEATNKNESDKEKTLPTGDKQSETSDTPSEEKELSSEKVDKNDYEKIAQQYIDRITDKKTSLQEKYDLYSNFVKNIPAKIQKDLISKNSSKFKDLAKQYADAIKDSDNIIDKKDLYKQYLMIIPSSIQESFEHENKDAFQSKNDTDSSVFNTDNVVKQMPSDLISFVLYNGISSQETLDALSNINLSEEKKQDFINKIIDIANEVVSEKTDNKFALEAFDEVLERGYSNVKDNILKILKPVIDEVKEKVIKEVGEDIALKDINKKALVGTISTLVDRAEHFASLLENINFDTDDLDDLQTAIDDAETYLRLYMEIPAIARRNIFEKNHPEFSKTDLQNKIKDAKDKLEKLKNKTPNLQDTKYNGSGEEPVTPNKETKENTSHQEPVSKAKIEKVENELSDFIKKMYEKYTVLVKDIGNFKVKSVKLNQYDLYAYIEALQTGKNKLIKQLTKGDKLTLYKFQNVASGARTLFGKGDDYKNWYLLCEYVSDALNSKLKENGLSDATFYVKIYRTGEEEYEASCWVEGLNEEDKTPQKVDGASNFMEALHYSLKAKASEICEKYNLLKKVDLKPTNTDQTQETSEEKTQETTTQTPVDTNVGILK